MKVLILGASGLLGHTLFNELFINSNLETWGSIRGDADEASALFPRPLSERIIAGLELTETGTLEKLLDRLEPDVLVNAVGLVRQRPEGQQVLPCLTINSRLPHLLLKICIDRGIRLIHYSTDCVFDGQKGKPYTEIDPPSAKDVYGLSKYLGELRDGPALTLRTSIIGHELRHKVGLVEWFLSQRQPVKGYRGAIYTGLTAVEHARILRDYVFKNPDRAGIYHVASNPVSKYELLGLVNKAYGLDLEIIPDDTVKDDKRLDGSKFNEDFAYQAPAWEHLVADMRDSQEQWEKLPFMTAPGLGEELALSLG